MPPCQSIKMADEALFGSLHHLDGPVKTSILVITTVAQKKGKMNIRMMLMLSWFWLGASAETCPALYLRYSQNHTYCLPPQTSCTILSRGVTKSDIEVILSEHNALRSKIAIGNETAYSMPKASNMLQMVWDDELAAVAQKHADQCTFEHDCNDCRRVKNFDVGQNLFMRLSPNALSATVWVQAVKDWYDEIQHFQKDQIDGFTGGHGPFPTGHFTQEIWAGSWRIGCGHSMYAKGSGYEDLYTCNYGPIGNVLSYPIYKKGDPCTSCPINSCCGTSCAEGISYPGLCRIDGDNAPQYRRPEGFAFYCSFNNESDCATTTSGADKWEISKTLSETYIGIVLNGGESSKLSFTTPFKVAKTPMCFISHYRTGPQVSGEKAVGTAMEIFEIPASPKFSSKTELKPHGQMFTQIGAEFSFNAERKFSVSLSVPAETPAQYLELKELYVKQGPCQ